MSSTTTVPSDNIIPASDPSLRICEIVGNFLSLVEKALETNSATIKTVESIATFLDVSIESAFKWVKFHNLRCMTSKLYSIIEERHGAFKIRLDDKTLTPEQAAEYMNTPQRPGKSTLLPAGGGYSTYYKVHLEYTSRPAIFEAVPFFVGKMTRLVYEFLNIFVKIYSKMDEFSTLRVVGCSFEDLTLESALFDSISNVPEGVTEINDKSWPTMDCYLNIIKNSIGSVAVPRNKSTPDPKVLREIIAKVKTVPGAESSLLQKFKDFKGIDASNMVKIVCVSNEMGIPVDCSEFMIYAPIFNEGKESEYVKNAYRNHMTKLLLKKLGHDEDRYLYHSLVVERMIKKYCQLGDGSMVDYLSTFLELLGSRIEPVWVGTRIQHYLNKAIVKFILTRPEATPENQEMLKQNLQHVLYASPRVTPMIRFRITVTPEVRGHLYEYLSKSDVNGLFPVHL